MSKQSIEQITAAIIRIAAKQYCFDESTITPSSRFAEDLGSDSLDVIELVMALEEEFSIEIGDEDAENLQTVADAAALVERLLA